MSSFENFVFFDNLDEKGENLFHCLCHDESDESFKSLEMLVNDVNSYLLRQYNSCGQQCVHITASRNTLEAQRKFELLIRWGADINSQEKCRGDTPLHIAALTKNYILANWICQQPSTVVDVYNFDQKTPWRIAYDLQDLTMMWMLQVHGAQRNIACSEDRN